MNTQYNENRTEYHLDTQFFCHMNFNEKKPSSIYESVYIRRDAHFSLRSVSDMCSDSM